MAKQTKAAARTLKRGDRRKHRARGRSMAVVGMAANPSGAHQAGRDRAGPMLPRMPGEEADGARCCAARFLHVWMPIGEGRHGTRRFVTPTYSVAAARSNVAPEMFRAITRTVLFDHPAASNSMNRVDDTSDAFARSPARCRSPSRRSAPSHSAPGSADPKTPRLRMAVADDPPVHAEISEVSDAHGCAATYAVVHDVRAQQHRDRRARYLRSAVCTPLAAWTEAGCGH